MGDRTLKIKNLLNLVGFKHRKSVTFMPKPFVDECGNGMHVHIQVTKNGDYIMYDENGYAVEIQSAIRRYRQPYR